MRSGLRAGACETRRRPVAMLALAGAASLTLLAACSSKPETRACPKVEVVGDLSRLVQFADGPGRDLADVAYTARIADVKSGCVYDKRGARVDMVVSIVGERRKAGAKLKGADIAYFVAITDAGQNIVGKQIFTSRLDFSDSDPHIDDELDQIIPLATRFDTAANHTIILGFQLTPEQINFNQRPRSN